MPLSQGYGEMTLTSSRPLINSQDIPDEGPEQRVRSALAQGYSAYGRAAEVVYGLSSRISSVMEEWDVHGIDIKEVKDRLNDASQAILRAQAAIQRVSAGSLKKGVQIHRVTAAAKKADEAYLRMAETVDHVMDHHERPPHFPGDPEIPPEQDPERLIDAYIQAGEQDLNHAHAAIDFIANGGEDSVSIDQPELFDGV